MMLRHLAPADAERLFPALRRLPVVTGQVIYEPDDEVDHIYFPETGLLGLVTLSAGGQEVDCTLRGPDGAIGYVEACGTGKIGSRVVVQIEGAIFRLPVRLFREVYEDSPTLRRTCARRVEFLMVETRQSIACQAMHPAPGRLARLLLECSDRTGEARLPLSQDFMAIMIGVGRTTVTHAAAELKRRGFIRYTRGHIQLIDKPALRRYSCECYDLIRASRSRILGFESVSLEA